MLDKSLEWYRIILKRETGAPIPQAALPKGYSIVTFQTGDEEAWGEIETSVLEFDEKDAAADYFTKNYIPYENEVKRRTLFIQADSGEKIATFTAWWNYTGIRRHPFVHWVAVKPQYQGRGLGKAIIAAGVRHMIEIEGDSVMYIPTSTWSHKAIRLYRWAGFEFELHEPAPGGFENQTKQAINLIKDRM
ncbi:GNAT family N-acetyltransferase [Paenibacillus humicola]|uniref:GNAT family N-acetyltransferase n=1 Tax=Paenibacillus humicola TaxID=3110540 RepID=UPI00237A570E|nr:GNAT family N-acetyltransferase [Paenibacillus humicola]